MTYGVEMARAAILREVGGVFSAYKIDVDVRHLELIADYMVSTVVCSVLGYRLMHIRLLMAATSLSTEKVSLRTRRHSSKRRTKPQLPFCQKRLCLETLTTFLRRRVTL